MISQEASLQVLIVAAVWNMVNWVPVEKKHSLHFRFEITEKA